jgi:hypothetical protein
MSKRNAPPRPGHNLDRPPVGGLLQVQNWRPAATRRPFLACRVEERILRSPQRLRLGGPLPENRRRRGFKRRVTGRCQHGVGTMRDGYGETASNPGSRRASVGYCAAPGLPHRSLRASAPRVRAVSCGAPSCEPRTWPLMRRAASDFWDCGDR